MSIEQNNKIRELEEKVALVTSPEWRASLIADLYEVIERNMASQPTRRETLKLKRETNG